ncbi:MAG: FadR/GntR family transcriptional regulator [Gemmatimonadaceae bacterium]
MPNSTPFGRRRLVDEVIDHLRGEISSGKLPTGTRLPAEGKLTEQLGVSRTTLREAIVVLSHDGLVDVRQGDGTFVRERQSADHALGNRSITELLELRRPLYLELTRLATGRRTESEASQLSQHVTELSGAIENRRNAKAREIGGVLEHAVGAAAHSPLVAALAQQTTDELAAAIEHVPIDSWPTALGSLVQSVRGILDRDAESADRYARLWLTAQASWLEPNKPAVQYSTPDVRRGPRARHSNQDKGELGGR